MNKNLLSWCLYDFANSSYSAVITAVIFPVFYTQSIVGNETGQGDMWWGNAVSLSMLLVAVTSPCVGVIADKFGLRKHFFIGYTITSILAVASFVFLQKGMALEGFLLFIIANFAMEGAVVFYNAYLPTICNANLIGRASAWGFGIGYFGSVLSLVIAIYVIKFDISYVWLMTAIFFAIFSLPAFFYLPSDNSKCLSPKISLLLSLRETFYGFKSKLKDKMLRRFLTAYLLYEDGVSTVIVFSSVFAASTLQLDAQSLVIIYVIVQVSALIGSFVLSKPIDKWSAKNVVILSLVVWLSVTVWAYFVETKNEFFMLATTAGFVLGSVQSASRAMFTKFIPLNKEGEYFGIYSLVGKTSSILGPMLFGFVSAITSSQRLAALSLAVFFIAGIFILLKTNCPR